MTTEPTAAAPLPETVTISRDHLETLTALAEMSAELLLNDDTGLDAFFTQAEELEFIETDDSGEDLVADSIPEALDAANEALGYELSDPPEADASAPAHTAA